MPISMAQNCPFSNFPGQSPRNFNALAKIREKRSRTKCQTDEFKKHRRTHQVGFSYSSQISNCKAMLEIGNQRLWNVASFLALAPSVCDQVQYYVESISVISVSNLRKHQKYPYYTLCGCNLYFFQQVTVLFSAKYFVETDAAFSTIPGTLHTKHLNTECRSIDFQSAESFSSSHPDTNISIRLRDTNTKHKRYNVISPCVSSHEG